MRSCPYSGMPRVGRTTQRSRTSEKLRAMRAGSAGDSGAMMCSVEQSVSYWCPCSTYATPPT